MIEGTLAKPGPGGGGSGHPPGFRVTVPSVDVDWVGFADWNHETGEETRFVIVPLNTNRVDDIRTLNLNDPFDDDERNRPKFPHGGPVKPDITLHWEAGDVLGLFKGNATNFVSGTTINAATTTWPLNFTVNPLQPALTFKIYAKGQVDNFGAKAVDTIRGRVVNVDLDVDANYDGNITGTDESLEEKQGGLVCVCTNKLTPITLKLEPANLPGKLTLSATGNRIRVWREATRATPVPLPATWPAGAYPPTLYVEGTNNSATARDVELALTYDENPPGQSNPLFKCADVVRLTVLSVKFIDDFPDYSLDANTDSDNHFFRRDDDHEDLDIYYKIMPSGVTVDDVKIKVYNGDTSTVLESIPGETDASGAFKTGDRLHLTWTAPDSLGTSDPGFYRLQLQVFAGKSSTPLCKTSIDDADTTEIGWQCPDDCLAIHDMVYKHRPVLKIASGEISEPVSVTFAMSRSKIYEWKYNVLLGIWLPDVKASNPINLSNMLTYDASQYWFGFVDANDRFNPPSWIMRVYHLDSVSGDYAFLQYWMYFATSYLPTGKMPDTWWHEGDWEMYQFVVKLRDSSDVSDKSKWYESFAVTCSQHYYGQTLKWKEETGDNPISSQDQDYVEKSGAQPVLYVALKSHALHFRTGEFKTVSGAPVGSQHQYQVPTSSDFPTDITGAAATRLLDTSHLIYIKKDVIINGWKGKWGAVNQPASIPVFGDGPSSPKYRGPSEAGGSLTIQSNPKGLHNLYLKTGQSISIP